MFKPGKYFIGDVSVVSEYAPKKQYKTSIPCANFLAETMIIPSKYEHSGKFRVKNGYIGIVQYDNLFVWENKTEDYDYCANDIGIVLSIKKPFSFMCTKGIFVIQSEDILITINTNKQNDTDKFVIPDFDEEYEYEDVEEYEDEEEEEEEDEEEDEEEEEEEEEEE
jgi:hypothetical protein